MNKNWKLLEASGSTPPALQHGGLARFCCQCDVSQLVCYIARQWRCPGALHNTATSRWTCIIIAEEISRGLLWPSHLDGLGRSEVVCIDPWWLWDMEHRMSILYSLLSMTDVSAILNQITALDAMWYLNWPVLTKRGKRMRTPTCICFEEKKLYWNLRCRWNITCFLIVRSELTSKFVH